jgi:hypothetical protein
VKAENHRKKAKTFFGLVINWELPVIGLNGVLIAALLTHPELDSIPKSNSHFYCTQTGAKCLTITGHDTADSQLQPVLF